jgi:hypothetical protein
MLYIITDIVENGVKHQYIITSFIGVECHFQQYVSYKLKVALNINKIGLHVIH